jgi:hypothetical protein
MSIPRERGERQGIRRYKPIPEGGHFAALEVPELSGHYLREVFNELAGG